MSSPLRAPTATSDAHTRPVSVNAVRVTPPTIAEDVDAEIREEKESPAQNVVSSYTFDILEMMEREGVVEGKKEMTPDAIRLETRRVREGQLRAIQGKRAQAKKKFDLVEELFERSMERRLRAMRRIAADPPADRLIGHSMAQYIPADLIPGQARQTASYISLEREPAPPLPQIVTTSSNAIIARDDSERAIVFLTELDGTTNNLKSSSGTSAGINNTTLSTTTKRKGRPFKGQSASQLEGPPSEIVERWRELGYNVVYATDDNFTNGRELPRATALSAPSDEDNTTGSGYSLDTRKQTQSIDSSYDWMRLVPVHKVCLVQRRLPEEDMKRKELMEQAGLPPSRRSTQQR